VLVGSLLRGNTFLWFDAFFPSPKVGWLATFPLDVVKTRVQGSQAIPIQVPVLAVTGAHSGGGVVSLSPSTPLLNSLQPPAMIVRDWNPYRTTWSTIVYSYRNEGPGVFFRGLSPTLIR
jgi:solute carrier family 25 carnitine/acylcarnitine transporter 20/29